MSESHVGSSERAQGGPGAVTGTVETNGIETYYERRGDGPPVVFLHGAIMDHRMWGPQVTALADEYTVLTYDVRTVGPAVPRWRTTRPTCSSMTSTRC